MRALGVDLMLAAELDSICGMDQQDWQLLVSRVKAEVAQQQEEAAAKLQAAIEHRIASVRHELHMETVDVEWKLVQMVQAASGRVEAISDLQRHVMDDMRALRDFVDGGELKLQSATDVHSPGDRPESPVATGVGASSDCSKRFLGKLPDHPAPIGTEQGLTRQDACTRTDALAHSLERLESEISKLHMRVRGPAPQEHAVDGRSAKPTPTGGKSFRRVPSGTTATPSVPRHSVERQRSTASQQEGRLSCHQSPRVRREEKASPQRERSAPSATKSTSLSRRRASQNAAAAAAAASPGGWSPVLASRGASCEFPAASKLSAAELDGCSVITAAAGHSARSGVPAGVFGGS